eukprot:scaffold6622_cov17-Tisochrysis_lutea.AAC.2
MKKSPMKIIHVLPKERKDSTPCTALNAQPKSESFSKYGQPLHTTLRRNDRKAKGQHPAPILYTSCVAKVCSRQ